jgi:hypothetical protein
VCIFESLRLLCIRIFSSDILRFSTLTLWLSSCSGYKKMEIFCIQVNISFPLHGNKKSKAWVEVNIVERFPCGHGLILRWVSETVTLLRELCTPLLGYLTKIASVCVNWLCYEIDRTGEFGTPFWSVGLLLNNDFPLHCLCTGFNLLYNMYVPWIMHC